MSKKYTKLFSFSRNLYIEGAPVIIRAGALSKNNENGSLIAQLKIQNITDKKIRAVKAELSLFDSAYRNLDEKAEYQYLDLYIARGEDFGAKTPIRISDPSARSFEVKITEVVFSDLSVWQSNDAWENCPRQDHLSELLDDELIKQYQRDRENDRLTYMPISFKDIWFCGCGAVNKIGEKCHECGAELAELDFDESVLAENFGIYKMNRTYDKAEKLLSEKTSASAKEALALFKSIIGWKDSHEKIKYCEEQIAELERSEKASLIKEILITVASICAVIVAVLAVAVFRAIT